MMHFSKSLKATALAGLFGAGFLVAMTSPALAERSYTRCDNDGDRCYRGVCDNDGDRCRTSRINTNYYGNRDYRGYYNNSYYNSGYYGRDYDRNRGYYSSGYRHWVCDSDGDRCHWSYSRW